MQSLHRTANDRGINITQVIVNLGELARVVSDLQSNLHQYIYIFIFIYSYFFLIIFSRLPNGGLLEIAKVYPLDAVFDTPDDVPEDVSELSTRLPCHF